MQTFVTERLILTPLAVADADAVYAIYSHPEILKLYPEKPIAHPSDTIPFMERITADGNLVWSIRFKENQPMIGDCALHHRNKMEGTIEIGGALLPEFWGKGVMREAFTAIMAYAICEMNIHTFLGRTSATNTQAIRLVEKLGFTPHHTDGEETVMRRKVSA